MMVSHLMQAMADAGAPFDAILLAVRAIEDKNAEIKAHADALAKSEAEADAIAQANARLDAIEEKRLAAAARKRAQREREKSACHSMSHDNVVTSCDIKRDICDQVSAPPNDIYSNPPRLTPPPKGGRPLSPKIDVDPIVSGWNSMADRAGLARIRKLDASRKQKLLNRLRENTPADFAEAIAAVERSPFCRGENDRGWKANFDFILQPASFIKLLEGAYDANKSGNRRGGQDPTLAAAAKVFGEMDFGSDDDTGRFEAARPIGLSRM